MKAIKLFMIGISLILVSTANANSPNPPVKVQPVKHAESVPTIDVLGTVQSRHHVSLTAGISGRLEWVAEPGTYVEAGEPVARIEQLSLQLQKAEQLAQIKRAKINLTYQERELERQRELKKQNNTSIFQFEQTQSQFELAKSDLEIAELRLKQIEDQLARTVVKAPAPGVITQRFKRAGTDVNPSDVVVDLLDTESLEVSVYTPIRYLPHVRSGNPVILESTERSDVQFTSADTKVIPAADPRSQTFEIRVNVPVLGTPHFAAGQLIKVKIPVAQAEHRLSVHRDALILRRDGTYVAKVDENNVVTRVKVSVGQGEGDWVMVSGDLSDGDQVITRGAERLKDGDTVAIQSS